MIAALQSLRAQEIRDLTGTARQLWNEVCLSVAGGGIDDPQCRTVPALGDRSPVQRRTSPAPSYGDQMGQRKPFTAVS